MTKEEVQRRQIVLVRELAHPFAKDLPDEQIEELLRDFYPSEVARMILLATRAPMTEALKKVLAEETPKTHNIFGFKRLQ